MPSARARRGLSISTIAPSTAIVPASGRVTPYTIFINVLLPAPFSPSSATISPGITSSETESLAIAAGYRFVMFRSVRRGVINFCMLRG